MKSLRSCARDVLALGTLAAATLMIFWALVGTNLVLTGTDAFAYFTPYRDYANAALREGRLPLWNPYLFLGVPFLANIQAGVLYPLNRLFAALWAPKALAWSVVLHVWLSAAFTYGYARRCLNLQRPAAWIAAAAFAFSGFLGGQVEHVNQLSAGAWFPLLLWLSDRAVSSRIGETGEERQGSRWSSVLALGLVMAVQLLAGHSQSAYISLCGLGVYGLWPLLEAAWRRARRGPSEGEWRALAGRAWQLLAVYGPALALGLGLAAVQLLPTLELTGLSARAGGFPYRQAVSFSLMPRMLLYTLFPTYGEDLGQAFGSVAFTEYVAYIGILGLLLAAIGVWQGRPARARRRFGALAVAGFLLALGAYNPVYFLLYKLLPGFDLFRAPARWLFLFTFGSAMLAGLGANRLLDASDPILANLRSVRLGRRRATRVALGACLLIAALLLVWQRKPGWLTWMAWGMTAAAFVALWLMGRRHQRLRGSLSVLLPLLLLVELVAASRGLPHADPTAPEAVRSLRTAPAHLLSDTGLYRFISLSGITFDPGDLPDLEQLYGDELSDEALYDLVVASKQQEILAPNLPLLHRIPAVDGYDGGILPLARYVLLQRLFLDEADVSTDGRLRELLEDVPPHALLDLLNVKYVITDKLMDVWLDDVYYDLQNGAVLGGGEAAPLVLNHVPSLSGTTVGVVSHLLDARDLPDGEPVAELVLTDGSGREERLLLRAGEHTAEGVHDATVAHKLAPVARSWPDGQPGKDYLAVLTVTTPITAEQVAVRSLLSTGQLVLRGLSLIDERTGAHHALTVSQQGRLVRVHSGDVKVYENSDVLQRAYIVHGARLVPDDDAALVALGDPGFDPTREVVLAGASGSEQTVEGVGEGLDESAIVSAYEPERVEVLVTLQEPGYLVLSDTYYPGWKASVDGQPEPLLRANLLFRAAALPEGEHTVVFRFEPTSLRWGLGVSLAAVAILVTGAWLGRQRRPRAGTGRVGQSDV